MQTARSLISRLGIAAVTLGLAIAAWHPAPAESQSSELVTQGRQALDANKIDDALAVFEKAVAADPNDPAALAWLGSAQVRKAPTVNIFSQPGWVQKGFKTLDEAVDRFPNAFIVYMLRGTTAARVPEMFGKIKVAVSDLSKVLAMRDQNPQAVPETVMPTIYLNLGLAYKKNDQATEARATWEKAKKLYPASPESQAIDDELQAL